MRLAGFYVLFFLNYLLSVAIAVSADPAPLVTVSGTLTLNAAKKAYSLEVPTTISAGKTDVVVGSYSLPLTIPEGLTVPSELVGQQTSVSGYIFGDPRALLVVDLAAGKGAKAPDSRKRDLFNEPIDEKKGKEEKKVAPVEEMK